MKQNILKLLPTNGEFILFYYKKDGSVREAKATLDSSIISQYWESTGKGYAESDDVIRYFDMEALAWRSFRVENFVDVI